MKYFQKNDFKFLQYVLDENFIKTLNEDYEQYIKLFNSIQVDKYKHFLDSSEVHHIITFIRIDRNRVSKNLKDVQINDIFFIDLNKNEKDKLLLTQQDLNRLLEVEAGNKFYTKDLHNNIFKNTLSYIDKIGLNCVSESIWEYKKGFVQSGHTHDDGFLFLHILLEDVEDGELVVSVESKLRILKKRGNWVMFDPTMKHSAWFTGKKGKVYVMCMEKGTFENITYQTLEMLV